MSGETPADVPKSGVLVWNEDLCTGCGVCELMCSLLHNGVTGRALSRVQVIVYHFTDRLSRTSAV